MGWVDWLLRPFQGRTAETRPAPPSDGVPATSAPSTARTDGPATPARPKASKAPKAPKAPDAEAGKKPKKKARKHATQQTSGTRTEVLPLAEAERRYGAVVAPKVAPALPAPAPMTEAQPDEPPPPIALRPRDPADEARRSEAADNRRRARIPQFRALLSRADALLAVAEAEPRHLVSSRRQLVDGWSELGRPPEEDREALLAARDTLLAALDVRIAAAAATAEADHRALLERKQAIVEEARALVERAELKGAGPALGELRNRLRALGRPGPDDPTAVAFAAVEKRLKERQEQVRTDRDTLRQEQLARLEQLVGRAVALSQSADPETAAERVKSLQAAWKEIRVPGPRTEVDDAWARFRAACDAVFANRTAARTESARVAVERMEAIVVRMEALAESGVDGDPDDEIEKALVAWKKIGRAPRDAQQALWDRLGRAFDHLRAPPVELGAQDPSALQFRPFQGLVRDDEG